MAIYWKHDLLDSLGRLGALMQPPVNSPLLSPTVTIKFIPFSIHLLLFTLCSSVVISKKVHLFNLNDRFVAVVVVGDGL
ncbi:unnamed protein product [Onchocerca flexuosa]|uniref:PPM-type phosphatase domain-containing protein n=1 Tax=Onchocerca flexuosa TaxID=387005 RepID=A0A183H7G4_9BILA|nr:unnamed protein product [Onchocerca flexuosa]